MGRIRNAARYARSLAWRVYYRAKSYVTLDLSEVDWSEAITEEYPIFDEAYLAAHNFSLATDNLDEWDLDKYLVVTEDGALFQSLDEMDDDVRRRHLEADELIKKMGLLGDASAEPTYKLVDPTHWVEKQLPWLPDEDLLELMIACDALDLEREEIAALWGVAKSDIDIFYAGGESSAYANWIEHIDYKPERDHAKASVVANDMVARIENCEGRGLTMPVVRQETIRDFIGSTYESFIKDPDYEGFSKEAYFKVLTQIENREKILQEWLNRGNDQDTNA